MDQNEFYKLKALKENWKSDPIWDLEETEGFEKHREELKAFREECEKKWVEEALAVSKQKMDQIEQDAAEFGCTPVLLFHINRLEERIAKLEKSHVS
jgi:hypothetical protein